MTSEEKQEIINAVLAALRTNSKSIDQLTPVSEMSDTDFLELNGGRKVSYGVLFANHMSNDEAQEGWEYLDTKKVDKDLRGLVEVHQAPVVFLDAMGILDGHSLNGGDGLEYRPDYKQIFDFPGGLFGAPKAGAVYISKNNFKKFVWNGTDLEELKADECPLFVDYSEPVAFATLPVGGSYYVPSSHKIAVKIDASNTKTYDPLPDALYFFRDKGKVYTWNSSTNKWVPVSSDINVVNNLTDGGGADALSAEQGKLLNTRLSAVEGETAATEDDGFFVVDNDSNIGMKYDDDGFDVALLSEHFIQLLNEAGIGTSGGNAEVVEVEQEGFFVVDDSYNIAFSVTSEGINAAGIGAQLEALVGNTYAGQCVVRFLPFLSAWNNASKNSLCLCATKQQIVNNKIPFYDGFLFHKLPTDDKSLWYGTTLENAVQIGTVNFTPKNCLLAMSPTDGRVIATVRGDRGDIHVWDGTTDHTVAAVTSDGNNRKAMGWLYNSGVDFIKDGNNVERCIFAEYDGSVVDNGGFYVWVGTYPYTSASNWKTTLHKPLQYYGTIQDGTITHFHQIRRDPWTNILYLTSGDQPGQLVWWYSTDYGDTWTELTNNKTNGWEEHVCRLINFCFTDEWIYWATDHGTNHCLNRIKRNAQTGVIDPSTREKLCDLPFAQACNSICLCESPKGIFMYERIDTGTEYQPYYGSKVKMLFWSIPEERLYTVAELGLTNNSWGGSRGKCYLNYTNGQQPRPAMGFSDDTRCYFDIVGADNSNIGTIFYEL